MPTFLKVDIGQMPTPGPSDTFRTRCEPEALKLVITHNAESHADLSLDYASNAWSGNVLSASGEVTKSEGGQRQDHERMTAALPAEP